MQDYDVVQIDKCTFFESKLGKQLYKGTPRIVWNFLGKENMEDGGEYVSENGSKFSKIVLIKFQILVSVRFGLKQSSFIMFFVSGLQTKRHITIKSKAHD